MIYRFREYELDLELYQLRCHGGLRKLEPKAFNVLRYLIEHRDRIVPKEELLTELWDSPFIGDAALNSCIMAARRAVGDRGDTQQVVQTQRGRGYRFIAPVTERHTKTGDGHAPATGDTPAITPCPHCARHVPLPAAFCPHCGVALSGEGSGHRGRPRRLEMPLVGREREAARLQALLQGVQVGKGHIVDIVGEAGMGKSHLVDHFHQQVALNGVTLIHVFCPSVRMGPPGAPIRDALRQSCGLSPNDGVDVIGERLTGWLSQLDIESGEVMPYLLHVLGCSAAYARRITQQPALLKVQLLMALRHVFVAYSQRRPLVLAVEDIQWLDQTSADYLAMLMRDISTLPILLLLTRRPDLPSRLASPRMWHERGEITSLPLQPLAETDCIRLLQAVWSPQTVAPSVEFALLARAEGHPGLLTQLAQWCVDRQGSVDPEHLSAALPTSLSDVAGARLACAPEATRQLLQTASVLGPTTGVSVLEQIWDGDQTFDAVLEEVVSAGFYDTPHRPVDGIHRFSQVALLSSIYHHLTDTQRQYLHTRVAQALEGVYAEHIERVSGLLAWHYVQAGQPERSLPYWREMAREAARWGDYVDAIDLAEQMLAIIGSLPKRQQGQWRLECLLDRAHWLTALGRCRESVELLQIEHEAFLAAREARLRGQYTLALSLAYSQEGAWEQAVACTQQAIENALACQDGATAGQAYTLLAMERYRIGRADEGAFYSRQAIGLLEQPETETKRALAFFVLGLNCVVLGQFNEAIEAELQAQQVGEALADPQLQAFAAWAMGWALATQGEWSAAMTACQRALATSPDLLTMAFSLGVLGYIHLEQEAPQEAVTHLEQAIRTMQACGYKRMQGLYTTYLGIAHLQQGELDRAQVLAEESQKIAIATTDRFSEGWALRLLGQVAQRRGTLEEARELLDRAVRAFLSIRASFEVARTQLHLAAVSCEQGEYQVATVHTLDAYHRFTTLQVPVYIQHTQAWAASRGLALASAT